MPGSRARGEHELQHRADADEPERLAAVTASWWRRQEPSSSRPARWTAGRKDEAGLVLRFLMQPDVALELMLAGADPHRTDGVLADADAVQQWLPIWDDDNIGAFKNQGQCSPWTSTFLPPRT
jgi:hypothetical protein